jgi:hypothetical protein
MRDFYKWSAKVQILFKLQTDQLIYLHENPSILSEYLIELDFSLIYHILKPKMTDKLLYFEFQ